MGSSYARAFIGETAAAPKLEFVFGGDAVGREYHGYTVAYLNNLKVGYLDWGSDPDEPDTMFIRMIEVEPDYRRRGIATALVRHTMKQQGFNQVDQTGNYATPEGQAWRASLGEGDVKSFLKRVRQSRFKFVPLSVPWAEPGQFVAVLFDGEEIGRLERVEGTMWSIAAVSGRSMHHLYGT